MNKAFRFLILLAAMFGTTTALVNVHTSADGSIISQALTGLNSGTYAYNAYRMVIDWDNSSLSVWVNGTRVSTDVAFDSDIAANLADGYNIIIHSHAYTGSDSGTRRYMRNIMIHEGAV